MTFLVEHPDVTFLVDPALCAHTRTRVLSGMPAPKRRLLGGGSDGPGIVEILDRSGVSAESLDFAVATHLHWDHISGMLDLPGLALRASADERPMESVSALSRHASIPALTAHLGVTTFELDGPPVLSFTRSHDLFGDGSVVAVDLPGHTPGSIGLLLALNAGPRILLIGDAAWNVQQIGLLRQKAPFPGRLADRDRRETFRTLHRLHVLPTSVRAVPAHDSAAAAEALPGLPGDQ
jgi:glyoxylase-like metal-dependent hydrolase (beta-lactamase superfamily II)